MNSEMNTDFVRQIVEKQKLEVEKKPAGFRVGYAAGIIIAYLGVMAVEAVVLMLAMMVFSLQFSFWQAFVVVALFEYATARRAVTAE